MKEYIKMVENIVQGFDLTVTSYEFQALEYGLFWKKKLPQKKPFVEKVRPKLG